MPTSRMQSGSAMTVAAVALVFALAGTAVAGPDEISSALSKGKPVTKSKVKKLAKKQANKQIDKRAPGLSVAHADTAGSAASVDTLKTNGSFENVAPSATNNDPDVARANATEVPLLEQGSLSVYAKCFKDADDNSVYAEFYVRTTQNGSLLSSHQEDSLEGDPFLDTNTPEDDRQIEIETTGADSASTAGEAVAYYAAAPDGTVIQGEVNAWVKNGTLAGGQGLYGAGDRCVLISNLIVG